MTNPKKTGIYRKKLRMIQAISAITYIENGLRQLLASGQLFGKINRSNTTLSVYLNTKAPTNPPQKSVRSSNHHANMQNMLTGRRKPWNTKNISIEFYEPQFLKSGKPLPNVLLTRVRQLPNNPTIKPFNLTIYEYRAAEMDMPDIDAIFKEIMNFVNSGFYKDPFINTEKMANVTTREADIPGAVTPTKNDVQMNISNGEYGADNVVDETKRRTITLSEGKLRSIIRESLVETMGILEEGKLGRALGTAALGAGLMFGHPQQANAQLNVKHTIQDAPKVLVNVPMDNKSIEVHGDLYYLKMISTNRFDDRALCLTLGRSVEQCLRTLNDLKGLVDNKTAMVEVGDNTFGDLTIEYGSVGIGERGLWFSQRGCAGKSFMHRGTIDKMIAKLQESEPTTYNVQSEDYFDDWQPKRSHDLGEPVLGKKRRNQ